MDGVTRKKKLIEVALPLDDINKACVREKSIRHGHPSTLHLWWARRPLAAARAVIFAQMVDDPSGHPELFPTEQDQERERNRLFGLIVDLVQWENSNNEEVLQRSRSEMLSSWRSTCAENATHRQAAELFNSEALPDFYDPFAGGGALPFAAQRLGLRAYASDLNPVAVLLNKAMIEIPPRFSGRKPVNPKARAENTLVREWRGAEGLASDVRYYGELMREEAESRIGQSYPPVVVTSEMAADRLDLKPIIGSSLTVIAWVWARTVRSPNPAFHEQYVPLVSNYMLSTKKDKEVCVEPIVRGDTYDFVVKIGKPKDLEKAKAGTKAGHGANFSCLLSGTPIDGAYIKSEAKAGRMGERLIAIVAEGERGRIFLSPRPEDEELARKQVPSWKPDVEISGSTQYIGVKPYGIEKFSQLFTDRQTVALETFSDLVQETRERIKRDALNAGMDTNDSELGGGGSGASAYADSVATYLALAVSKSADYWSNICIWRSDPKNLGVGHVFARQAIPMTWDFAEANPFSNSSGSWLVTIDWIVRVIVTESRENVEGHAFQCDAQRAVSDSRRIVSTDPPYFDNVPYADLSDFFYVWLRRSLRATYPDLFATLVVPKTDELVAFEYRHESKTVASTFFMMGMTKALRRMATYAHPAFPVSIYYAFKQSDTDTAGGTASTGWETFLDAVIRAGFSIDGTWPIRTELANRTRGMDSNALASSIVLVCRPRDYKAKPATRREFLAALKSELPMAVAHLQQSNIAPVDLAQAAIGPGMAVFCRFEKVLEADGRELTVRDALALINSVLDEVMALREGDFEPETRFAISWFEQSGFDDGEFGVADVLARAKNTSVGVLNELGLVTSRAGKVRLRKPSEMEIVIERVAEKQLNTWMIAHYLIRELETGGESLAARLVARIGARAEVVRELAYRLYTIAERRRRASEAMAYNGIVQSWPEIVRLSRDVTTPPVQTNLLGAV
jgi:putative DNA methylase